MNDIIWKNSSKYNILFKKSAHFLYRKLIAPKHISEDDRRREFILNIILSVTIVLLLWSEYYIIQSRIMDGPNYQGIPVVVFTAIVLLFVFLYTLSRAGNFVASSYGLVIAYFVAISYASYHWGTDLPTALLGYGLLIVISSILINTRFSFIVAATTALIIISLIYLENEAIISPARYWLTKGVYISDGIQYSLLLFIITVVSWLSNREIERSLQRARTSEAALKEQKDLLEITVEERTKELQAAQAEKIDQLYRFAEFGRLASGLFHDLMNPLTSVSLYLEKVNKNNPAEAEQTKEYLSKAFEASKRIESFTKAIRKQLQHRQALELFSVNEGVRQAMQLVAHKAWQGHIHLEFESLADIVTYDNPLKFHQIMVNLLSNAIDSYQGLSFEEDRKREAHITLAQQGQEVLLTIQDWGCGIAADSQGKIFQPFYTTKDTQQGTGIGLSTTKEIIERDFQGTIQLDSTEGQGTTFRISFLRHDPPAAN